MTTDELFAQMEENPELYLSSDEYCMLESDTSRVVLIPDRYTVFGVEGDTNVERVKFKFPKIVGDNVDLTTLNLRVNFQNADGKLDKYLVDDVEEAEEGYITFSWVIQDGLTPKKGQISFVVQALKATSEGKLEKKWGTTLNKVGQILEGLEVDEEIAEQNPDIIEAILTRIDELEKNGGGGSVTPGKDGREVELQNSGTAIQWRYVGEEEWKDLVQLSELKGKDGDPGENGITPTIGENGNWFLSGEDTGKPSRGEKGDTGAIPNIQIGEVTTLEPGQQATASITGTAEEPKLNIGIPKGEKGEAGSSSGGSDYTLPIMTQDSLGGGKAVAKTEETVPVAVDPETGQLFVPTYPESSGGLKLIDTIILEGESVQNIVLIDNLTPYKHIFLKMKVVPDSQNSTQTYYSLVNKNFQQLTNMKTWQTSKTAEQYTFGELFNDGIAIVSILPHNLVAGLPYVYGSIQRNAYGLDKSRWTSLLLKTNDDTWKFGERTTIYIFAE